MEEAEIKRLPLGEAVAALWAVTDEGRHAEPMRNQPRQLLFYRNRIAEVSPYRFCVPPLIRPAYRRATITFCGIAATGSYMNFDSLRDAPPQGKAFIPT